MSITLRINGKIHFGRIVQEGAFMHSLPGAPIILF
jgi:hypothetical protein